MNRNRNGRREKDVVITHVFNAPVEQVFRAWTEPEYLQRWFAPGTCTIEYKTIEVKTNGTYHSCLRDPVYGECWIKGTYYEVRFPDTLVFSTVLTNERGETVEPVEAGKPEDWPGEILTTVTFTARGGKTEVTLHQTVPEAKARQTGAYQSWLAMFERLGALYPMLRRSKVIDPCVFS